MRCLCSLSVSLLVLWLLLLLSLLLLLRLLLVLLLLRLLVLLLLHQIKAGVPCSARKHTCVWHPKHSAFCYSLPACLPLHLPAARC